MSIAGIAGIDLFRSKLKWYQRTFLGVIYILVGVVKILSLGFLTADWVLMYIEWCIRKNQT